MQSKPPTRLLRWAYRDTWYQSISQDRASRGERQNAIRTLGYLKRVVLGYDLGDSRVEDGVRGIHDAVKATNTPATLGIPGYVVPVDLTARMK
jgi:hypothetical protein